MKKENPIVPFVPMTCHAEGGCNEDVRVPVDKVSVYSDPGIFMCDPIETWLAEDRLDIIAECTNCGRPTVSTYFGRTANMIENMLGADAMHREFYKIVRGQ